MIIPNVLGVVFTVDKKMAVYNMATMTAVEDTLIDIPLTDKLVVRWRKHEVTAN